MVQSHVGCTGPALCAVVTAAAWAMVPGTLRFNLNGRLSDGAYAMRFSCLSVIGNGLRADGANHGLQWNMQEKAYPACQWQPESGPANLCRRRQVLRLALNRHAVMMLSKWIVFSVAWQRANGVLLQSDDDAVFEQVCGIDSLGNTGQSLRSHDFVDNVSSGCTNQLGVKIDEAFLGSCNNGRIEDLRVGAAIIKGKKVAPKVRFLVVPASRSVYLQAMKEGLLDIFMDAGAIVMNPNCSVCWGSCQGVIGEGETLISTGTRNFKGRAGHKDSFVYLASAATVTASAIKGEIATADMV